MKLTRQKLALNLGMHILDAIQKMQEEKKDFGRSMIIPFELADAYEKPPWMSSVEISMPFFHKASFNKIKKDFELKRITMAKYYGWKRSDYKKGYEMREDEALWLMAKKEAEKEPENDFFKIIRSGNKRKRKN